MGILDTIGGIFSSPATEQKQLNTVIAKQVLNTMSQQKFNSSSAITQSASVVAIGPNSKNQGVDFSQVATINLTAFLNQSTLADLKSDLKENISNAIKNEATNMPFGQVQNVNTLISNTVDKSIEVNVTHENIVNMNNSINQSMSAIAMAGGENSDIRGAQTANTVSDFSNIIANDISTKLVGSTGIKNTQETKTTNFLSETIGAIGSAVNALFSGLLKSALLGPLLLLGMFLGVVLLGFYMTRGSSIPAAPIYVPAPQTQPVR